MQNRCKKNCQNLQNNELPIKDEDSIFQILKDSNQEQHVYGVRQFMMHLNYHHNGYNYLNCYDFNLSFILDIIDDFSNPSFLTHEHAEDKVMFVIADEKNYFIVIFLLFEKKYRYFGYTRIEFKDLTCKNK